MYIKRKPRNKSTTHSIFNQLSGSMLSKKCLHELFELFLHFENFKILVQKSTSERQKKENKSLFSFFRLLLLFETKGSSFKTFWVHREAFVLRLSGRSSTCRSFMAAFCVCHFSSTCCRLSILQPCDA